MRPTASSAPSLPPTRTGSSDKPEIVALTKVDAVEDEPLEQRTSFDRAA